MAKFQTKAIKHRGFPKFVDPQSVYQYMGSFSDGVELLITLEEKKNKTYKSYNQLKMIHAMIKLIDIEIGTNCKEETKDDVKRRIGFVEYKPSKITGKEEERLKSFADMTKEEGIEVINQILGLCEWLNIFIPPDADYDYWMNI